VPVAAAGATVTYTIRLLNGGPALTGVRVTDTLPAVLTLIGPPVASSGAAAASSGQVTWTGEVTAAAGVTITYAAQVASDTAAGTGVVNSVALDDGASAVFTRTAAVVVDGEALRLPYLRR
jgi:uncharacterized repeat protein (TIGR01451 family)